MEHRLDIDPLLRKYCEDFSTSESENLREVERLTNLNTVKRLDASDMIQGRLISFVSHLIAPKFIVEIGTFTAYATGCLAEGLAPGGKILSLENNPKFEELIRGNLKRLDIEESVDLRLRNALDILPTIEETIDLVFIDAAKYQYGEYYNLTIDKLRSGGVILADNILWKGRVLQHDKDKMTQAMHDFNIKVSQDDRVEVMILPYRDGLSLIRKR